MEAIATPELLAWGNEIYKKMEAKLLAECKRVGSDIPFIPVQGQYKDLMMPDGIYWWTNGFWPGLLWQMYNATGEICYKTAAEGVEARMDEALHGFEGLYHDVGFMFLLSAVADYRITGNEESKRRGMHAATILAGRYNPKGRYIRAWNENAFGDEDVSGWMIIDCLMNLPLLFWASEESGDPRFAQIACNHADTALQYILRPDGSCNHIAVLDSASGEFLEAPAGQGYGVGSAWSRGHAWAVYGYALAYRHTGKQSYLEAAKICAHYSIANLAVNDWLPLVDFRAPAEPVMYDSTAGATLASGLLELAQHVPELEKRLYVDAAVKILQAGDAMFNNWNPDEDGIVGGGSIMYHNDRLAGASIIYGDYYFVEAILRLLGKETFVW